MSASIAKLGIGAARFGAPAQPGRPPGPTEAEAFAMVALAAEAGVRLIDVGEAVRAEEVLGRVLPREPAFQVVIRTVRPEAGGVEAMLRRVRASIDRLGRVHAVMVRPAGLLFEPEGQALWTGLRALQGQGLVAAVGIGACLCDDPVGLARRYRPDLMQLPLSLLDQRALTEGVLGEIAALGVELHLRSVFLRGLLFDPDPAEPAQLSRLRRLLAEAGADPMQAALAFALERVEASRVIVGLASPLELRAVLAAARAPRPALDWAALRVESGPCRLDPRACRAA